MDLRRRSSILAVGLFAAAAACSASPTEPPLPTILSGSYKSVSPGTISEIVFDGSHRYTLIDGTCTVLPTDSAAGAACTSTGRYALDPRLHTLSLTNDATDQTSLLSFEDLLDFPAVMEESRGLASSQLRTLDNGLVQETDASLTDETGTLAGDGGALAGDGGDGGALIRCATKLYTPNALVPQAANVGGQALVRSASDATSATTGWPGCTGSFQTVASPTGGYYVTNFGCSSSPASPPDNEDNCCASGAGPAAASGRWPECSGVTRPNCSLACANVGKTGNCNAWRANATGQDLSNIQCEAAVNYYATGAGTYGLGHEICLTARGQSVVVYVFDSGPSCAVERRQSSFVLDVSYPTVAYLFGGQQSVADHALVHVSTVPDGTALGPPADPTVCGQGAAGGDAGTPTTGDDGGGGGPGSGSGDDGGSGGGLLGGDGGSDGGACAFGAICASDADCNKGSPLGLVCANGACASGCHTKAQCPTGQACVGARCQGSQGGAPCKSDATCNPGNNGAGLICSNAACVPGCHANWQCPGSTSCKAGQCS